jgi:hypothetical protein
MAAPDGNRLASKFWIIALFDRRIKGVHVDMDDLPWRPLIVHALFPSLALPRSHA